MGANRSKLSEEEFHRLKKENLLAIQSKFYELMEKNPSIFKVPNLLY